MTEADHNFFDLTKNVYQEWRKRGVIELSDKTQYELVESLKNPNKNGAKGIVVAPILNDKTDYSNIIISYKGTNIADRDGD